MIRSNLLKRTRDIVFWNKLFIDISDYKNQYLCHVLLIFVWGFNDENLSLFRFMYVFTNTLDKLTGWIWLMNIRYDTNKVRSTNRLNKIYGEIRNTRE